MMDFEEGKSGLLTPKQKAEKPKREYGPTEIRNEKRREMARKALEELWKAMSLHDHSPGIPIPDRPSGELCETYDQLFNFVGKLLLGEDCPGNWELT